MNVLDVNDNAPRFYTSLFQESVSESVATGFSIVRVGVVTSDTELLVHVTLCVFNCELSESFTHFL